MNAFKTFTAGQRVVFTREVDYSFESAFVVPEGTTGVVTESSDSLVGVKVDAFVKGLSDSSEWRGVFMWTDDDEDLAREADLSTPFKVLS